MNISLLAQPVGSDPERPKKLTSLTLSLALHFVAIAALLAVRLTAPDAPLVQPKDRVHWVEMPLLGKTIPLSRPLPKVHTPRIPPALARVWSLPRPKQTAPALMPPAPRIAAPAPSDLPALASIPAPPEIQAPKLERPAAPVQTGMFVPGSPTPGTLLARPAASRAMAVDAGFGSGAGEAGVAARRGVATTSGLSGFGETVSGKGTSTERAVATGGFGATSAGDGGDKSSRVAVSAGGFGAVAADTSAVARRRVTNEAEATAVEIVDKPRPEYTEEARRLRVEGVVQLSVLFAASGEIRIMGVLNGLGHGLDENAARAARAIRFKPARRDGRPVDSTATVHILFQLAS